MARTPEVRGHRGGPPRATALKTLLASRKPSSPVRRPPRSTAGRAVCSTSVTAARTAARLLRRRLPGGCSDELHGRLLARAPANRRQLRRLAQDRRGPGLEHGRRRQPRRHVPHAATATATWAELRDNALRHRRLDEQGLLCGRLPGWRADPLRRRVCRCPRAVLRSLLRLRRRGPGLRRPQPAHLTLRGLQVRRLHRWPLQVRRRLRRAVPSASSVTALQAAGALFKTASAPCSAPKAALKAAPRAPPSSVALR